MGQIEISGKTVLFDDADADLVATGVWFVLPKPPYTTYVRGYVRGTSSDRSYIYLHRMLLGFPKGKQVDHINGNGLDNRRANLRVCSATQNAANRQPNISKSSPKGIHFEAWSKRWRAQISKDGIQYKLGRFDTMEDASRAYAKKAKELYGEFAHITSS